MSLEEAKMRERQAGIATEQERKKIVDRSATDIVTFVQALLEKIMADEDNQAAFWDDTPAGKKQYLATLLHEAAKKLGLTPDEVKEASADKL